jgi:hypothetical protein
LVRTHQIFPFDLDSSYVNKPRQLFEPSPSYIPHTDRVLRPELVSQFHKPVKSDLLKTPYETIKKQQQRAIDPAEVDDVKDLLELSYHLRFSVLPKLVRQLDDLKQVVLSNS